MHVGDAYIDGMAPCLRCTVFCVLAVLAGFAWTMLVWLIDIFWVWASPKDIDELTFWAWVGTLFLCFIIFMGGSAFIVTIVVGIPLNCLLTRNPSAREEIQRREDAYKRRFSPGKRARVVHSFMGWRSIDNVQLLAGQNTEKEERLPSGAMPLARGQTIEIVETRWAKHEQSTKVVLLASGSQRCYVLEDDLLRLAECDVTPSAHGRLPRTPTLGMQKVAGEDVTLEVVDDLHHHDG